MKVGEVGPFLGEQRLGDGALHALRDLCDESPTLDVVFNRTGRFADVLYLAPEPASGLQHLTAVLAERWLPDFYGQTMLMSDFSARKEHPPKPRRKAVRQNEASRDRHEKRE